MKAILLAAGLALACPAMAGEDSTDHWGAGGTGPAWYQAPCSLADFAAAVDHSEFHRCAPRAERRASEARPDRAPAPRYGAAAPGTADRNSPDPEPLAAGLND